MMARRTVRAKEGHGTLMGEFQMLKCLGRYSGPESALCVPQTPAGDAILADLLTQDRSLSPLYLCVESVCCVVYVTNSLIDCEPLRGITTYNSSLCLQRLA